jgi:hypothetical protein
MNNISPKFSVDPIAAMSMFFLALPGECGIIHRISDSEQQP